MATPTPVHKGGPTREEFLQRYGRYYGKDRIKNIDAMGYYIVEAWGEGPYIWDTEGNRYLDFFLGGGIFNLGHRNPVIMDEYARAVQQEDFGTFFWPSEAKGELVKTLAETEPTSLCVTLPAVTGSEAVDESIKMARGATGRYEVLYAKHAYHGHTGLSLTMMAADDMRVFAEPLVAGFRSFDFDDANSLAEIISERTACVILEPVQTDYTGRGSRDPNFWQEVRRLCDEHGAKLILDEVITGMGRLGEVWGCHALGIDPDMICLGKGFSGGALPIAAVLGREDMLDFWGENPYKSVSSYAWSNVACRTTTAAIKETQKLLPQAMKMGDKLESVFLELHKLYPDHIASIERTGLCYSIEVNEENFNALEAFGGMWERGVNIYPSSQHGPLVKVFPPLVFGEEHIAEFAEKFEETIKAAEGGGHAQWF